MTRPAIIVAHAENGVIGSKGVMPWHIPEDLKHFKKVTMGHPVIMGRVTHESIGRPLPGRLNIVISRNPDYAAEGCRRAGSLEEALCLVEPGQTPFVIGGAQIYAQALDLADVCWITEIHAAFEGDAFFKPLDRTVWSRVVLSELPATGERPAVSFCVYRRK